jgi:hypothetical protein
MLILVAVFVWLAATQEAKATQMKYAWGYAPYETYHDFRTQPRSDAWAQGDSLTDDDWRHAQARMMALMRRMWHTTNSEEVMVPVVRDGRVVGWALQRRWR